MTQTSSTGLTGADEAVQRQDAALYVLMEPVFCGRHLRGSRSDPPTIASDFQQV